MDEGPQVAASSAEGPGKKGMEEMRVDPDGNAVGFTLQVLYLFAGAERKTSVVEYLRSLAAKRGWKVNACEVDLKRGQDFDLTSEALQTSILKRLQRGEFHVVICTPPCSTWSRVRCANLRGPPPLRSKDHLWGFPWVKRRLAIDIDLGNTLVRFSIEVWTTVCKFPVSADGFMIFLFGEHPEDLGAVVREEDRLKLIPASIWQIEAIRRLVQDMENSLGTVAINQCCWGAPWRKPTRLLSTSTEVLKWGPNTWPQFDDEGFYVGPLQRSCNCQVSMSLARTSNLEGFRTTGTDVYPPRLDEAIAMAIMRHMDQGPAFSSKEGEGEKGSSGEQETEEKVGEKRDFSTAEVVAGKEATTGEVVTNKVKPGFGVPLRCYYKGEKRTIHDGGGLCSPGRWPVEARKELEDGTGIAVASCCRSLFLKWILGLGKRPGDAVKEVFWSLAGGKVKESPFGEFMSGAREALDEKLVSLGLKPKRQEGDRECEVHFRRLQAMLMAVRDEDAGWLEEAVSRGVRLGVDMTMPRVPAVFEEKVKWNLEFTEEEFQDSMACNYKSAEENAEDIERQVMEEVEKGSILRMSEAEAQDEFKGRLAVAALGAVPKELGSSVVRIAHDGSYSVDVNHRIKVLDRMRFPGIDDASGVLTYVDEKVEEQPGLLRCSLLYDIARAHKLVPVDRRDWGYQAFRLPGNRRKDEIFLHTRGTFGIASAAYHWQRLAAGVVRLIHRLGGRELGVLHLLFADDGWLTALGEYFWRKMLFWLFVLELVEVPLSWKKVRGGLTVQWIGYQLDVDERRKGISGRKVRRVTEWIEKHQASGGVTGRALRSALGRFCFVAGALQHVRPFLGPLFAWSAVLGQGTFARFPDAVAVLLDFVKEEINKEPMTRPRRWEDEVLEVFRVDAKAEGDHIVVGGWEIPESGNTLDARWFSVVLNRRNAPWAYLKGEPFRNIASLELVAVLVAVILFGDRISHQAHRKKLTLTASTDNLGNTFVLSHFMSCKFPLSIVVMELAAQLRRYGMEMDLGWIPRGQNAEADALTNSEFEGFDLEKRITLNFEDLKFLVMDKLMRKAATLDEEIKLAKSSKEAKNDRPMDSRSKRKRGQTRWEDPW